MNPGEQQKLLADVNAFCEEIRPIEELCYVEHTFNKEVLPLARKHKLLGMILPAAYGGRSADTITYARALALIGREGTGVRTFFSGHISIGQYPVLTWGNEEQKRRYLPAAGRGDKLFAFGLTEPEAGSNPLEMQMTYERRGEQFILNGVKYLISNGGIADVIITFAYPKGGAGRISAFIVDTGGPGFAKEDLTAKMGMPTANTAMFELTNYAVPAGNLLGQEGDGFRIAMGTLVSGRLSVAAGCLGVIEDCLTEAVNYARERIVFERPIGANQGVQFPLARAHLAVQAAGLMRDRAAWRYDQGLDCGAEASGAKLMASEASWLAGNACLDVHGGMGFAVETDVERKFRETRLYQVAPISTNLILSYVAEHMLGLPRSF